MEISANSEIEKQHIEADMRTQISHVEAMERREAEFVIEKAKEKELVASEMQAVSYTHLTLPTILRV